MCSRPGSRARGPRGWGGRFQARTSSGGCERLRRQRSQALGWSQCAAPGPGRLLPASAATPAPAARTPLRRAPRNARRKALPGPARPGAAAPEVSAAAGPAPRSAAGTQQQWGPEGSRPGPGARRPGTSQPSESRRPGPWGAGSDPGNSGAGGFGGEPSPRPGPGGWMSGGLQRGREGTGARRLSPGGARSQRPGQTPWRPAIVGGTRGSRSEFRGPLGARCGASVPPAPRGRETWRSRVCGAERCGEFSLPEVTGG